MVLKWGRVDERENLGWEREVVQMMIIILLLSNIY
jgi:hypothetical protein